MKTIKEKMKITILSVVNDYSLAVQGYKGKSVFVKGEYSQGTELTVYVDKVLTNSVIVKVNNAPVNNQSRYVDETFDPYDND